MNFRFISMTGLLVGVLLLAGSASAQLEVVGGATYNTYSIDWAGLDPNMADLKFNSGFGAYGCAQYWVADGLALGAQFDYFTGTGQDSWQTADWDYDGILDKDSMDFSITATGYLGMITTDLALGAGIAVRSFTAFGMYGLSGEIRSRTDYSDPWSLDSTTVFDLTSDERFGFTTGVSFGMELSQGLTLSGTVARRYIQEFSTLTAESGGFAIEFDDLEGLNISGFSVGAAVSYAF